MNNTHFRERIVRLCLFLAVGLVATGALALLAYGGLRGPGKYCGVVVYDRWDTCFLLSGPYITYVSENVKNELRPYAGKTIQVGASDVFQAMNPGDALIRKYKIIGPAPDNHRWAILARTGHPAASRDSRHLSQFNRKSPGWYYISLGHG